MLGVEEAHGQEHEVGLELALGPGDRVERRGRLGLGEVEAGDRAVDAGEVRGHHRVGALALALALGLLHRVGEAHLVRPAAATASGRRGAGAAARGGARAG